MIGRPPALAVALAAAGLALAGRVSVAAPMAPKRVDEKMEEEAKREHGDA